MTTVLTVLITAIGTNLYQIVDKIIDYCKEIKFKKIEIYEINQRDAIIKFNECVASFMDDNTDDIETDRLTEYYKTAFTLLAYFPKLDYKLITSLGNSLNSVNSVIASKLNTIISELSKLQSETK